MQRRAKALEHLPGPTPKLWLPGFMGLIIRKDPHRYSTVLAERFGPIFKFRVLCFHVRITLELSVLLSCSGIWRTRSNQWLELSLVGHHKNSITAACRGFTGQQCHYPVHALQAMHALRHVSNSIIRTKLLVQVVCITDPVLATHVLRSKHVDKLRFQYSFLDPVSPSFISRCEVTVTSQQQYQQGSISMLPQSHIPTMVYILLKV